MKNVWSVIGKAGGSGGNPEEWAIKGVLRSVVLRPIINDLKNEIREKQIRTRCEAADRFELWDPVEDSSECGEYSAILKYMYGGEVGTELQKSFVVFRDDVQVSSLTYQTTKLCCN
jgi:hypothetical protein